MKKVILIFLITIAFSGLVNGQQKSYFHKSNGESVFNDYTDKWYSLILSEMNEPILFNKKTQNEIYRFTWIRSFAYPVVVRIEKQGNQYILFWKTGVKGDKAITSKQKIITQNGWEMFQYRIKQICFWNLSTIDKSQNGMDGAEWILEGKLPGNYHITDRWTPKQGSEYYKCCDYLLSLTDIRIEANKKY